MIEPGSFVRHLDHYRTASETGRLRRELVRSQFCGFDSNFAIRRGRLHCIEKEIEYRAMQQIIIANDDQRGRRKQLSNCDIAGLVGVRGDEGCRVARDVYEVYALHLSHLGAREIEELRKQPGETI
jgi:hypothetical protein